MRNKMIWLSLIVILAVLDQISKIGVVNHFIYGLTYQVMPLINIQVVYNYGISFSLFSAKVFYYLIVVFGLAISLALMIWLVKIPIQAKLKLWSVSFILGGAVGNLVDRIFRGYVIDFIDFSIGNWHWYNFNLADAWISIGAFLMVLDLLLHKERKEVAHENHIS